MLIMMLPFLPCRGLFEKDKLAFSFMLCAEIMRQAGQISDMEWNLFLRGASGVEKVSHRVCSFYYKTVSSVNYYL